VREERDSTHPRTHRLLQVLLQLRLLLVNVSDDLSDDVLDNGSVLEQRESEGLNLDEEGVVPLLRLQKRGRK